jgi:succinoglycan biosynthesis transport protein ExoP
MSDIPTTQAIMTPAAYDLGGALSPTSRGAVDAQAAGTADLLRVIKQRKMTILITFVVLYLLVIATTLAVQQWAPAYPADAMMELEPPREDPMRVDKELINPDIMKQQIQTEARKLKQLSLILDVLAQPEIKATGFYQWYNNNIAEAAFELQRLLVSAPIADTNLIRVSLALKDKREAKDIVNAIVARYRLRYVDAEKGELYDRVEGLRNTLAEGQRKLKERREEMLRFQQSVGLAASDEGRDTSTILIGRLLAQKTDVDLVVTALQADLEAIRDVPVNQLPVTPEMRILVESDPVLRYYRSTVEGMDVNLRAVRLLMGKNHRQVRLMEAQREAWFEKEIARREELTNDIRERQIASIREDLAKYRGVLLRVQGQLDEASAQQRDQERNALTYRQKSDDEKILLKEIAEIQIRVAAAEHALNDRSRDRRLSVVQPAEEAVKPSRPDYWLYLGGGVVLAMMGAVGVAFLREFTDKAIRTPLDVARFGHLSVLGNIPMIDEEQAEVDSIEQATRKAPHSLVAEAFRQVRTNLQFSGPASSQRTLLITSPGPSDGKTVVAVNLAVTLAHSNQRVLLIDCNFRRPAVREAFTGTRREGLSNILIGQGKLADYVNRTELPNVDVLSSGPMPPNPAELLGSPLMGELMNEAASKYDRVLLDGPPALLISDAIVLAAQVDGVIVVTRAVTNSKGAVRRTREALERVNARVIGAVLNGAQARAGGYFRRQYRDFYEYVGEGTIPPELPELPAASEKSLGESSNRT